MKACHRTFSITGYSPAIAIDNVDIVHPLRAPEKSGVVGGLF